VKMLLLLVMVPDNLMEINLCRKDILHSSGLLKMLSLLLLVPNNL